MIKGRGYGHGVGLSQYGAKKRAEAGQTMKILQFYYRSNLEKDIARLLKIAVIKVLQTLHQLQIIIEYFGNSIHNFQSFRKSKLQYEKAKIGYKISENAKVTVTLKIVKGKLITTPAKQKSLNKGSRVVLNPGTLVKVATARTKQQLRLPIALNKQRQQLKHLKSREPKESHSDFSNYTCEKINNIQKYRQTQKEPNHHHPSQRKKLVQNQNQHQNRLYPNKVCKN